MPELPECESVVRKIRPYVWGCEIIGFLNSSAGKAPDVVPTQVQGQTIRHITRHGKYIIFKLDRGFLVSHLRMTGQWEFTSSDKPGPNSNKYFRWGFTIRGHNGEFSGFLWFKDVRKFGTLVWVESLSDYPPLTTLGPDGLHLDDMKTIFKVILAAEKTRRPIKNFLLDQKVIAGTGNIYASEALFAAKVHPAVPAKELTPEKIEEICTHLYSIFKDAIELGGSSLSDHKGGNYHEVLKVYKRDGEPCYQCNTLVVKITQAGRSTFLCPSCQGDEENELS